MAPREARQLAQRIGRSGREFAGDRLILSAWVQSFAEWAEVQDTIGRDSAIHAARVAARQTERG